MKRRSFLRSLAAAVMMSPIAQAMGQKVNPELVEPNYGLKKYRGDWVWIKPSTNTPGVDLGSFREKIG